MVRPEWDAPKSQRPGSTSELCVPRDTIAILATGTTLATWSSCPSVYEQVFNGRNDATPASGHRLLNAENDAYGNESGNDLRLRHLTFITLPGGVLTVKWEQPVHGSAVSLNERLAVDENRCCGQRRTLLIVDRIGRSLTPRGILKRDRVQRCVQHMRPVRGTSLQTFWKVIGRNSFLLVKSDSLFKDVEVV